MTETTPGETPVERRLREIGAAFSDGTPTRNAIDAGREAIKLLRRYDASDGQFFDHRRWTRDLRALLARCEGDR